MSVFKYKNKNIDYCSFEAMQSNIFSCLTAQVEMNFLKFVHWKIKAVVTNDFKNTFFDDT